MLWVGLVTLSKYWAHQTIEKEASLLVGGWVGREDHFIHNKIKYDFSIQESN
jgi:hypothetical protein